MDRAPLSFVFFARESARLAARKARARRAGAQPPRLDNTRRDAERRWEGEGGNHLTRMER
jgi:hypothetical protein